MSKNAMLGLIDSLESAVRRLRRRPVGGTWSSYEQDPPYTPEAFERKGRLVAGLLGRVRPETVWDLGANTGHFSRLAAGLGSTVAAFDGDPDCIEAMYVQGRERGETQLLPLVLDLFNPSPASGWMNRERASFFDRGRPDLVMALALVHHLAIAGNQPMSNVAELFRRLAPRLLIEFVPETDPQVRLLVGAAGGRPPSLRSRDLRAMLQPTLYDRSLGSHLGEGTDPLPAQAQGRLIRWSARVPIYPLLFAVYPILVLFAQNAREVRSLELLSLLAAAAGIAAMVWLVLGLLLRSAAKGALVTAAAVVPFYTVDRLTPPAADLVSSLTNLWVRHNAVTLNPLWIVLPELALLAGFAMLVGRLGDLGRSTRFLNLLAVIAVAMPVAQIATVKAPVAARPARQVQPMATATPAEVTRRPDIYYIILDGYARHDVMASHFDFDNSAFLDHLRARGFYVAPAAARPTTARRPCRSRRRSTRATSTTWSRACGTTRPSCPT